MNKHYKDKNYNNMLKEDRTITVYSVYKRLAFQYEQRAEHIKGYKTVVCIKYMKKVKKRLSLAGELVQTFHLCQLLVCILCEKKVKKCLKRDEIKE